MCGLHDHRVPSVITICYTATTCAMQVAYRLRSLCSVHPAHLKIGITYHPPPAFCLPSIAQVVVRLDMVPQKDALCPGEQLQLYCRHNTTNNDPAWRVMNGTREIFRGITFQGSNLEGHTLTRNTTVLEVLQIGFVQRSFHGLRYSCLYDTFWGEKKSNEVTVNLHGRCVHMYECDV